MIHHIKNSNGEWIDSEPQIYGEATSFFQELFTAENVSTSEDMFHLIPRVITEEENARLT